MAKPSRPALELLEHYAEYHRDQRNIVTHFVGIPMVVFAAGVFGSGLSFSLGGWVLTPAWLAFCGVALWYLTRGHLGLGLATTLGVGLLVGLAHKVSAGSLGQWLALWLGFLAVGWVVQLLGHYYEGRIRPFADVGLGLLVGPMFVALQLLAPTGLFKGLVTAIERHAGPTFLRDLAHPAAR